MKSGYCFNIITLGNRSMVLYNFKLFRNNRLTKVVGHWHVVFVSKRYLTDDLNRHFKDNQNECIKEIVKVKYIFLKE